MAIKGTMQTVGIEQDTSINQALGVQPQGTADTETIKVTRPDRTPVLPEVGMQGQVTGGSTTQDTQSGEAVQGTDLKLGNYYKDTVPLVSSWENKAESIAGTQFQQNVLAGKQTLAKSAQEQQMQGQEMQTQLALGEYMRAQSTEKAGWTGGYMLDQKRQGDYLKASIQAQMYGAQELQKYGMETQLEAARLAYDLGKEQLAYQMYQEAQQLAVTEAQMFGYYVSPEIKDMVNQYNAATTALADNPDDERAKTVKATLDEWFSKEGMSPNDLSRFGRITMEREQWNQGKLDAVLASIGDDPSTYLMRDDKGRYVTDPATGQYVKMNFEDVTTNDLLTFLAKDDGSTNKFADTAFRSYAKYLAQSTINAYFSSLAEGVPPTEAGYQQFIAEAGNDRLQAYLNELGLDPKNKAIVEGLLANNFNPSLTRGGVTISYGAPAIGTGSEEDSEESADSDTPVTEDGPTPTEIIQTYENPETPALEIDSINTETIEGEKEFTYTDNPETNWILNNNLFDGAVYIKKETKYLFDTGFFKDGDIVKIPKYDQSIAQTGNVIGHTYGVLKDGKLHEIDISRVPGANKDAYFGDRLKDLESILVNRKVLLDHETSQGSTKATNKDDITSSYIFNFLDNRNITKSNKKDYMDGISKVVSAALNGTLKEGSYITFGNSQKALYYKGGKFYEITNFTLSEPAGTASQRQSTANSYAAQGLYANWGWGVDNLINQTNLTNTNEGEGRF